MSLPTDHKAPLPWPLRPPRLDTTLKFRRMPTACTNERSRHHHWQRSISGSKDHERWQSKMHISIRFLLSNKKKNSELKKAHENLGTNTCREAADLHQHQRPNRLFTYSTPKTDINVDTAVRGILASRYLRLCVRYQYLSRGIIARH